MSCTPGAGTHACPRRAHPPIPLWQFDLRVVSSVARGAPATIHPVNLLEPDMELSQWGREDSNLRRLSRRVYSPFPLAARAHPRERAAL